MILLENGKRIGGDVKSITEAKKIISGLDYSMACVDAPRASFILKDGNKIVYRREIKA